MADDHNPLKAYERLGLVIAMWSQLEHSLRIALCDLASIDHYTGLIIFSQMNANTLIDTLIELSKLPYMPSDFKREMKTLTRRLHRTRDKRNQFAHGLGFSSKDDRLVWITNSKGNLQYKEHDLMDMLKEIKYLINEIEKISSQQGYCLLARALLAARARDASDVGATTG